MQCKLRKNAIMPEGLTKKGKVKTMATLCGAECSGCSFGAECKGCGETCGKPFGGECVAAEYIKVGGAEEYGRFKESLLREVNELLRANDLPELGGLCELPGSFINMEYTLPGGERVKFLDDTKVYLAGQTEISDTGLCCGVAADTGFILVCSYGEGGKDAELLAFRKR